MCCWCLPCQSGQESSLLMVVVRTGAVTLTKNLKKKGTKVALSGQVGSRIYVCLYIRQTCLSCMWSQPELELVHCSTSGTKTALFLLNPGFHCHPSFPLQYAGVDFPSKAEKHALPLVWKHNSTPEALSSTVCDVTEVRQPIRALSRTLPWNAKKKSRYRVQGSNHPVHLSVNSNTWPLSRFISKPKPAGHFLLWPTPE